jgi:hypothetical protein
MDDSARTTYRSIGWTLGGIGAVGVGVGIYFATKGLHDSSQACDVGGIKNLCTTTADKNNYDSGIHEQEYGAGLIVFPGAALVTGALLVIFAPKPSLRVPPKAGLQIRSFDLRPHSLTLGGSF